MGETFQPEINKTFSAKEIADFVIGNDKDRLFLSAAANFEEFIKAIERMDEASQVIVFINKGELWGVLGWVFTTDESKHLLSKQIWRLPENIVDGDILYLSFIATKGNCNVVGIKTLFEQMGYRKRINKRRGFTNGKWCERKIFKGDTNG